ncbi:hypothetical protein COOONC_10987, partial [Cooperia oncophora]
LLTLREFCSFVSIIGRFCRPEPSDVDGEDEDLFTESLTPLRKSIVQLASDLRDSYLTTIANVEVFEAELLCCSTLDEVKEKLRELADSISPSAIVKRVEFKVALQTGQHSCMILDRWKQRLAECHNVSGVQLLRSYLDSRIDWKQSIIEKVWRFIFCSKIPVFSHSYPDINGNKPLEG